MVNVILMQGFFLSSIVMNITGPDGESGDIGVLNPASTTAPVTRQSRHSLEEVMGAGSVCFLQYVYK